MLKVKIKRPKHWGRIATENHVPAYPYFGIYEGRHVVLFVKPSCGYSVTGSQNFNRWEYSETWVEKVFKKFNGKIILRNEEGWEHEQQPTSIS